MIMNIREELDRINKHFDQISDEELLEKLVKNGLGDIKDPEDSGFYRIKPTLFSDKDLFSMSEYIPDKAKYYDLDYDEGESTHKVFYCIDLNFDFNEAA